MLTCNLSTSVKACVCTCEYIRVREAHRAKSQLWVSHLKAIDPRERPGLGKLQRSAGCWEKPRAGLAVKPRVVAICFLDSRLVPTAEPSSRISPRPWALLLDFEAAQGSAFWDFPGSFSYKHWIC